jgi:DNA-binding transcriptional LysR family regulator
MSSNDDLTGVPVTAHRWIAGILLTIAAAYQNINVRIRVLYNLCFAYLVRGGLDFLRFIDANTPPSEVD